MEIILVRHAQPDYSEVDNKGYLGFGRDLAPLTPQGMEQAQAVSRNALLVDAELIISSPYTRALQTAAIISRNLDMDVSVEIGFHERLPDVCNHLRTKEEFTNSFADYDLCKGVYTDNNVQCWESIEQQINRIQQSLRKYAAYRKIIIVTHGELIRRFAAVRLPFCGLVQIEYNKAFSFLGWS